MKKRKFGYILAFMFVVSILLSACSGSDDEESSNDEGSDSGDDFSLAMATDVGGVDDKSFNQSAWEGIEEFGEEHGLEKGDGGYDYLESKGDTDYNTNLNNLIRRDFELIFGVGFDFEEAMLEIAEQRPETKLSIIDGEVDAPNVASVLFKDNEGAFLAGVVAANMTETGKVGFIGGVESPVIERFESGFRAGVAAVDPDIEVDIQYAGAYDQAEVGKTTANKMYSSDIDIIFHSAGATGNGVFSEAKERKTKDPDANVWVIGVDRDQYEEGAVEVDGEEENITLTSSLKLVGVAVQDIADKALEGEFPGGETVSYGLKEEGVGLADSRGAIPDEVQEEVEDWTKQIQDEEITIPGTTDELDDFIDSLD